MLLAFDTCMAACSAAVFDVAKATLRASRFARMERGHADVLAPMIKGVMDESGVAFADLTRLAVTVGPGTFTGVRTGIAMARGLGLALACPVVTLDTLAAIAANAPSDKVPLVIAADARRNEIYFAVAGSSIPPAVLPMGEAVHRLPPGPCHVIGTGAAALAAAAAPGRLLRIDAGDLPEARNFAAAAAALPPVDRPPEPLYLRPPDVKPQRQHPSPESATIRSACPGEATVLAALHSECFDNAWTAAEFAKLMAMPGAATYLLCQGEEPLAFVLARRAGGEAEILTIGTRPFARRRGLASRLITHLADELRGTYESRLFIEVAADNQPGRALYERAGFAQTGHRKAYYERPGGGRQDAIVMMKALA